MGSFQPIYKVVGCVALTAALAVAGYFFGLFARPTEAGEQVAVEGAVVHGPDDVMLVTGYLNEPIGGAHWIFLMGTLPGPCKLGMDKATRQPDRFGDVRIAAPETFDVETIPVPDPREKSKESTRLFEIDGLKDLRLRIVRPRSTGGNYRLLQISQDETPLRVQTLEPYVLRALPSPVGGSPP